MENTKLMQHDKAINPILSISVLLGFIASISLGQLFFEVNLNGLLLIMLIVLCGITRVIGYSFEEILEVMVEAIKSSLSSLFIFILIGALISSWIFAGSLPAMVYFGIDVIHPSVILPGAFILCMTTSLIAGTSWGTVSTVGLIIMEIAGTMDVNLAPVAGAVISGACFGDKLSPMSDTTNLAAMSCDVPIMSHIKSMLKTTIPTTVICLTFFTSYGILNMQHIVSVEKISQIQSILHANFNLDIIALIPIFVTITLTFIVRSNALVSFACGIFSACIVGVYWQDSSWSHAFTILSSGYSLETGNLIVNKLLNRGGIDSMMNVFAMSILVISIGGILAGFNYLSIITTKLECFKGRLTALSTITIGTTAVNCMASGDSYMPIIVSGRIFRKIYDSSNIARNILSRCCEDGATLLVPIIPWSVTAIFFSQTLGVETIHYLPFAMLCWLNPIISIMFSFFEESKTLKQEKDLDETSSLLF